MLNENDKELLHEASKDFLTIFQSQGQGFVNNVLNITAEQRQLTITLATLSGAVATFTIPLFLQFQGVSLIFLFFSILCLFIVILIGFISLSAEQSEALRDSVQSLRNLESTYDEYQKSIAESYVTKSLQPYINHVQTKSQEFETKQKTDITYLDLPEWDSKKTLMLTLLSVALVFILISVSIQYFPSLQLQYLSRNQ